MCIKNIISFVKRCDGFEYGREREWERERGDDYYNWHHLVTVMLRALLLWGNFWFRAGSKPKASWSCSVLMSTHWLLFDWLTAWLRRRKTCALYTFWTLTHFPSLSFHVLHCCCLLFTCIFCFEILTNWFDKNQNVTHCFIKEFFKFTIKAFEFELLNGS